MFQVKIFVPPKSAMQSGSSKTNKWVIAFTNEERWANPLMGWTSNADPFSNLKLNFDTLNQAIEYANLHGLVLVTPFFCHVLTLLC